MVFSKLYRKIKTYHDKDFSLGSFSIFHFQFSICESITDQQIGVFYGDRVISTAWQMAGMVSPCWTEVGDRRAPVPQKRIRFHSPEESLLNR